MCRRATASARTVSYTHLIGGVVIEHARVTVRVAREAGVALIHIAGHAIVVAVSLRVHMASGARKHREVIGVGMAVGAGVPLSVMRSTVDRKELRIMVECGRCPTGIGRVAGSTISGESRRRVVRVHRVVEILLVAGNTFR